MTHPVSERQQLKLVLQMTTPRNTTSALDTPVSPTSYLTWSTARRRAWDRRHTSPNSYFLHYLHPSLSPRLQKWSLQEHITFLAALRRSPPSEQWGLFSLLVPGRIGSDCRRYYHRIGRAGFITIDGKVRSRLLCRAKVIDEKNVLQSSNPLFLRRSLRKFVPDNVPKIDDSLYKVIAEPSFKKKSCAPSGRQNHDPEKWKNIAGVRETTPPRRLPPKSHCSSKLNLGTPAPSLSLEDAQDLLTYVPVKPSEEGEQLSLELSPDKDTPVNIENDGSESVPCRLRIRDSNEKKNSSNRSFSLKSKNRCSGKTKVASPATSGRTKNSPVTIPSAAVKLRTKSARPTSSSSSGRVSQSKMKTGSKLKEPNKPRQANKSNKTSKNGEQAEKQNGMPNLAMSSRPSREVIGAPIPRKLNTANCVNVLPDPRKPVETNIGKQPDVVVPRSRLDYSTPSGVIRNPKRRSVKPLRPILTSQDGSKKRREKGKSVHFSPTEAQRKESTTSKQTIHEEDGIQWEKNRNDHTGTVAECCTDHDQGTDPKIRKTNDSTRRTQNCTASENLPAASAITVDDAVNAQADVTSSARVGLVLEKGYGRHLSGLEKFVEIDTSTSSDERKHSTGTPHSSKVTKLDDIRCVETPPATEFNGAFNSGQPSETMLRTRKTTPVQLHVGSDAGDSEKHSFEDKSQKRVETNQTEQSATGTESQSTGTDGEFLDMEVGMDISPGNQTELLENLEEGVELGTKLGNPRRVTGPTGEDRISIGFLMNAEDDEPRPKKRRVGVDENVVDNGASGRVERAVSLIGADRDLITRTAKEEDKRDSHEVVSVGNDAHSKNKSDYQLMQTRIEQTRLMLRLFVDMVDPIGEQLGHKYLRRKLLASFDETFQGLKATEAHAAKKRPFPISNFLQAANTAARLDSRNTDNQATVHLGGLTEYWGSFVDSYIDRVKDMEMRQKLEVESKCMADRFC